MSVVLQVDGMTCGHCVSSVEKAVVELPGVTGVHVDLATGRVTVDGQPDQLAVASRRCRC
jgi:copper chaperone